MKSLQNLDSLGDSLNLLSHEKIQPWLLLKVPWIPNSYFCRNWAKSHVKSIFLSLHVWNQVLLPMWSLPNQKRQRLFSNLPSKVGSLKSQFLMLKKWLSLRVVKLLIQNGFSQSLVSSKVLWMSDWRPGHLLALCLRTKKQMRSLYSASNSRELLQN